MIKRIVSVAVVAALTCALGGAPARANNPPKGEGPARAVTPPTPPAGATVGGSPGGKLRADMLKLVADAKAGRAGAAVQRRSQQPAMSNRLSKGQKIAIGVGIAVAVILTVVVYKATCDGMC